MSDRPARFGDHLISLPQYLLPGHLLSRVVHHLMRVEAGAPVRHAFMRWFIPRFGVDLSEAAEPDYTRYPSFNAFFTRALKPGVRPMDPAHDVLVSPVDGALSQCGPIRAGQIFQAKGRDYSVLELLGGDAARAARYQDGWFATIYLSPRDYHRIHLPLAGRLKQMTLVPGRLFSVNPPTTRSVPRLFARNERVATRWDTDRGAMELVMVGALFVASIETVWHGEVTPSEDGWGWVVESNAWMREVQNWNYGGTGNPAAVDLAKGEELGRFNMGSTVILLFEKDRVIPDPVLVPGAKLRLGQRIGTLR
jgi:phosphatidylserine decarboxylase